MLEKWGKIANNFVNIDIRAISKMEENKNDEDIAPDRDSANIEETNNGMDVPTEDARDERRKQATEPALEESKGEETVGGNEEPAPLKSAYSTAVKKQQEYTLVETRRLSPYRYGARGIRVIDWGQRYPHQEERCETNGNYYPMAYGGVARYEEFEGSTLCRRGRSYACPFCTVDEYRIEDTSGWLETPWVTSQMYETKLELARHVAAYHYPFIRYYRCPADDFISLSAESYELHITHQSRAHREIRENPQRWPTGKEMKYLDSMTSQANNSEIRENPYYVVPCVPGRLLFTVSDRPGVYQFGAWNLSFEAFTQRNASSFNRTRVNAINQLGVYDPEDPRVFEKVRYHFECARRCSNELYHRADGAYMFLPSNVQPRANIFKVQNTVERSRVRTPSREDRPSEPVLEVVPGVSSPTERDASQDPLSTSARIASVPRATREETPQVPSSNNTTTPTTATTSAVIVAPETRAKLTTPSFGARDVRMKDPQFAEMTSRHQESFSPARDTAEFSNIRDATPLRFQGLRTRRLVATTREDARRPDFEQTNDHETIELPSRGIDDQTRYHGTENTSQTAEFMEKWGFAFHNRELPGQAALPGSIGNLPDLPKLDEEGDYPFHDRERRWEMALETARERRHPFEMSESIDTHVPHLLQARARELLATMKSAAIRCNEMFDEMLDETVAQTELDMASAAYALGRDQVYSTTVKRLALEIEELKRPLAQTRSSSSDDIRGQVVLMSAKLEDMGRKLEEQSERLQTEKKAHQKNAILNSAYLMALMQLGAKHPESMDIFEQLKEQLEQQEIKLPLPMKPFVPK